MHTDFHSAGVASGQQVERKPTSHALELMLPFAEQRPIRQNCGCDCGAVTGRRRVHGSDDLEHKYTDRTQ